MPFERDWTRRQIFQTAAGGLASNLQRRGTGSSFRPDAQADSDRIHRENEHPGTRDWMTSNVRIDPKTKYR